VPNACKVCTHEQRPAIDQALVTDASNRRIATQYGMSEAAVRRHKAEHLPVSMVKAQEQTDVRQAIDVIAQLKAINGATLAILKEARTDKNGELALKAVDRIQRQLELQAKLLGELQDGPTVNITISPEWLQIRALVIQAVTPYPDAVKAITAALSRSERAS